MHWFGGEVKLHDDDAAPAPAGASRFHISRFHSNSFSSSFFGSTPANNIGWEVKLHDDAPPPPAGACLELSNSAK